MRFDDPHAITFFDRARQFVFFNEPTVVFSDGRQRNETGLLTFTPALAIHPEDGTCFPCHDPVPNQALQVGRPSLIDLRGVRIDVVGQFQLGPSDPKETIRIAIGNVSCLIQRHHVIGRRRHAGRVFPFRS